MGFWKQIKTTVQGKAAQIQEKKVLTLEELGIVLSVSALASGKRLFEKFEKAGATTQLPAAESIKLARETLTFCLVCDALSLARVYGEVGHKVADFLNRETFIAIGTNLGVANIPAYVEACRHSFNSHFLFYAEDIWQFCITVAAEDNDGYDKQVGPLGEKILRRILNPVIGIPLEKIKQKADEDFEKYYKRFTQEWKKVPGGFFLSLHVVQEPIFSMTSLRQLSQEIILQEYS